MIRSYNKEANDVYFLFIALQEYAIFIRDILCLGALIIGFRFLAFLALLSKTYRKQ